MRSTIYALESIPVRGTLALLTFVVIPVVDALEVVNSRIVVLSGQWRLVLEKGKVCDLVKLVTWDVVEKY